MTTRQERIKKIMNENEPKLPRDDSKPKENWEILQQWNEETKDEPPAIDKNGSGRF